MSRRWAAVLDGDVDGATVRPTRAEARADARWLRGHPARMDRVRFGTGGRVEVIDLDDLDEDVSEGGAS